MALRRKRSKPNKKRIRESKYIKKIANRRRSCQKKGNYATSEEAQIEADNYNEKYLFADMRPYWCYRHKTWHIGHWNKWNQAREWEKNNGHT